MSSAYEQLSNIYSLFMQDAPYDKWHEWLERNFPNLSQYDLADIGCGTGTLTVPLAFKAKSMIGVDVSDEMLSVALQQSMREHIGVTWLCQDMRQLRLPHQVDVAISTCDCVNYLLSPEDVATSFASIWEVLRPGGHWLFDVHGPGRLAMLSEAISYDLRDDAAILFESSVTGDGRITYEVHAFVEESTDLYRRIVERHYQQFYSHQELMDILTSCGFQVELVQGDFGDSELEQADRITFSAKKV